MDRERDWRVGSVEIEVGFDLIERWQDRVDTHRNSGRDERHHHDELAAAYAMQCFFGWPRGLRRIDFTNDIPLWPEQCQTPYLRLSYGHPPPPSRRLTDRYRVVC